VVLPFLIIAVVLDGSFNVIRSGVASFKTCVELSQFVARDMSRKEPLTILFSHSIFLLLKILPLFFASAKQEVREYVLLQSIKYDAK
jgi:hypothetical protein